MSYDINTYVDKIFYINLDHCVDRKEKLERSLEEHDIWNYERTPGVMIKEIPPSHGMTIPPNEDINHEAYLKGSLGCLAAHRNIISDALKRGYQRICVLEDDVTLVHDFRNRFDKFITELEGSAPHYQIAYLGLSSGIETGNSDSLIQLSHSAYGTYGYILNDLQWVFQYLLTNIDYAQQEIDLMLNNLIAQKCLSLAYLVNPPLLVHDAQTPSNIRLLQ